MFHITLAAAGAGPAALFTGFGINAWAFFSQLISFLVVLFFAWKYGLPLVLRTIDKRTNIIREGVENAERAKRDLAEATQNSEQIILDARKQAQDIIGKAEQVAEKEAQRIVAEAQERAEQVKQQQVADIKQEASRAKAELSRMVVNLSINAASKVIGKSVDSNDNRRLVEDFVTSTNQTKEQ